MNRLCRAAVVMAIAMTLGGEFTRGTPPAHGQAPGVPCLRMSAAGTDDWISRDVVRRCAFAPGFAGGADAAVTPDGRHVYAAAEKANAIVALDRLGDGTLRALGCVSQDGSDGRPRAEGGCGRSPALAAPSAVRAHPSGEAIYVVARRGNAVLTFARDPETGAVRRIGCTAATPSAICADGTALRGPRALAISPDGRHAYAAATGSDAVVTFTVGAGGVLRQTGCVSDAGTDGVCEEGDALREPIAVAVAPDGEHVYVAARRSNAVSTFARDGETGRLRQVGCVMHLAPRGSCARAEVLQRVSALAMAPDGGAVYAAVRGSAAVTRFARGADGALTAPTCIGIAASPACPAGLTVRRPSRLAALPDGRLLVGDPESPSLDVLAADPASGHLRRSACLVLTDDGDPGCATTPLLAGVSAFALTPDGGVYIVTRTFLRGLTLAGEARR